MQDRSVSVGVITPKSKVQGQQVTKYSVELRDSTGKKIVGKLTATKSGKTVLTTIESAQGGRVRVVVAASRQDGKKSFWNGPFITLK